MSFKYALTAILLATPVITGAQGGDVISFAEGLLRLINNFVIPLLLALAVLFFIANVIRFFILQSNDVQGRERARSLALYGVLTIVFIVTFWAIITFVLFGFGIGSEPPITPDFVTVLH